MCVNELKCIIMFDYHPCYVNKLSNEIVFFYFYFLILIICCFLVSLCINDEYHFHSILFFKTALYRCDKHMVSGCGWGSGWHYWLSAEGLGSKSDLEPLWVEFACSILSRCSRFLLQSNDMRISSVIYVN